ncbi:MAG: flagellin FliC [Planctomycetes bacterium]|nr:flagellin FliC [Planctomycetota bacterium]
MGLRINTNLFSLNAQRNLATHTNKLSGSFQKLSTGLRIANAADDAAGLAISERLRAQVRSLDQAKRNANDGISLAQTAEGALDETSSILVRLRELAIQSSNGTVSNNDKDTLDQEFQSLLSEINRISASTNFNGTSLLSSSSSISLQIGSGTTSGTDTLSITLASTSSSSLGLATLDIGSGGNATSAITAIDLAISSVASTRGQFGATINRLNSIINNLGVQSENLAAAESRIRDVDVAQETALLTRNSILQQAATSILAQANVQPQAALSLLG